MVDLAGADVLVVGGASGIGRALCRQLTALRCNLAVADKDLPALATLPSEAGGRIATIGLDLTAPASVAAALDWLRQRGNALDAVVMSAAVHAAYPAELVPDAMIERVLSVNLTAHIRFLREVLPLVKDGGRIVGLSSNCADIGIPMESVYAASKAGLERFYEALAVEISYRRIRPIVIQPGNVNTGFNETGNDYRPTGNPFLDDGYRRVVDAIDSRNGIDPEVVARAVIRTLESSRPRFRYLVGANARKAHWAKRLLGTDLALRVMARFFGYRFFY
jgi:NAD(P)-dependent dehydrogenase (short-subunit alcohol dehydrogenase family)